MSKNLTRKGLAFGALIALGTSVIAGAPAQAAGESITLASAYGTGTKTLIGSTFDLASKFVGWGTAPSALKYFITGATAAELNTPEVRKSTDNSGAFAATDADVASTTPAGLKVSFTKATNGLAVDLGKYADLRLGLASTVKTTRTITVTAFNDSVLDNGIIDDGEVASAPVQITFVNPAEVTAVTTLATPAVGSSQEAKAKVTLGDINLQQVTAGVVRIKLSQNGSGVVANAAWNKDDAALVKTFTGLTVAKTDVFNASAYLLTAGEAINGTENSTTGYTVSGTASGLTSPIAAGYDVTVAQAEGVDSANVTAVSSNAASIRSKTLSVAFKSEVTVQPAASASTPAPAGIPAKVIISDVALGTSTLTVAGKTLKAGGTAITIETVTDAAGYVNFTVAADYALNNERFAVVVQVADKDQALGYEATTSATYTYTDAAPAAVDSSVDGSANLAIVKGAALPFSVTVYDQFLQPYSSSKGYKAFVTSSNSTSGATTAGEIALTAGKGTSTVLDNSTTTGSYSVSVRVKEWVAASSTWATDITGSSIADVAFDVHVYASTAVASLSGTNTSTSVRNIDSKTLKNVNTASGASAPTLDNSANWQSLSGYAYAADGSVLKGASVTVAAAGVQFFDNVALYSVGSITVQTNASGQYTVKYTSNKAGATALTVTSGSATKAVDGTEFDKPTSGIKSVVATGVSTLVSGRTAVFKFTLTDKFGNTVKTSAASSVKISYTGPGYFTVDPSSITAPVDGVVSLTLITGATDAGTGTITFTSYGDNALSATDANKQDDATVAHTVVIAGVAAPVAVEPTSKIGTANSRVYVNVKDGKGSVVSVKIGAKWYTKSALNNDYTFSFKAKAKSKVSVKVYVDGDLSSSKTIIVKK